MSKKKTKNSANLNKVYHVTKADLPLSCPGEDMKTWNSHPKVYLNLSKENQATCPYCGAQYIMDDK